MKSASQEYLIRKARLENTIQFTAKQLIDEITKLAEANTYDSQERLRRIAEAGFNLREIHPIMTGTGTYAFRGYTVHPEECPFISVRAGPNMLADDYIKGIKALFSTNKGGE
ncbi:MULTISPECIES: hypothetical protein [Vibrio]|uniref:hypothetical protein n=1 Tax=Vibrio TaxID=662 RepID=UPI000841AB13|nr:MULTISPECIES: hypothetical protein [Vibrio]ODM56051.1 hypothetical protein BC455_22605 [Vibrio harveyi]USD58533.1 hypothetical protein J4N44_27960 [Vibrio sp. SCSIO 43155]